MCDYSDCKNKALKLKLNTEDFYLSIVIKAEKTIL